jgi:energy-coupling factor transporter ATP-binding protein EcfA2
LLITGPIATEVAGERLEISGGTGTGKTTLLNAMSTAIPQADTYEECRLAVGVTFVEHLVAPVRNRRKAARLDRDKRAAARIEHWLESEAATA